MNSFIDKVCRSVSDSSYGLSMGSVWQHISVECADVPENYYLRKQIFFTLLKKLLNEGEIKLAKDSVFLAGNTDQQLKELESFWPLYPSEDEDDDLDEFGMWFLVKAPAGIVWITSEGKSIWT